MGRRKKGNKIDGWVVLDKPLGMTSTAAVAKVRWIFQAQKAGHAGTLDPLATGVLPIALGEATKTVPFVMGGEKVYRFTVRWGIQTSTDDAEGEPAATSERRPETGDIENALTAYRGTVMQVPPAFSAIKVAGERAYDLAREGEPAKLQARPVEINDLRLLSIDDADHATFQARCGKGTYVRALARDIGRDLGVFGHVSALRRLKTGPFDESCAILLDKLEELRNSPPDHAGHPSALVNVLRPVETALDDIPALAMSRSDAAQLRNGQCVLLRGRDAPLLEGPAFATCAGALVALGEVRQGALHPTRVFNLAGS